MPRNYRWLENKQTRSVDALRLWGENPRLSPGEDYVFIADFAEEMTATSSDKKSLFDLTRSIVEKGFIPADPIVVWQSPENKKFYVAEGNRRILILKLLRAPHKAPKGIRKFFENGAGKINPNDFKKVQVYVAPNFEEAEWYISQRNSISTLQKPWSSEQQRRWIEQLFEKYSGDTAKIQESVNIKEGELQNTIRLLKLKSFVTKIKDKLTDEEYGLATSIHFPITTFERFFNSTVVREKWGIQFDGFDIKITSDLEEFKQAFASIIKRIVAPKGSEEKLDSRNLGNTSAIESIIASIPPPTILEENQKAANLQNPGEDKGNEKPTKDIVPNSNSKQEVPPDSPTRNRIVSKRYHIKTNTYRLQQIFEELKLIPPKKYPSITAGAIRIFLDLAIVDYFTDERRKEIQKQEGKDFFEISLSKRLKFLNSDSNFGNKTINGIIVKLLNKENEFSLDTLNGFQHSPSPHLVDPTFLNKFWTFLFPFFSALVEIEDRYE